MNTQEIITTLGDSAEFSSLIPLTRTDYNITITDISDKVTDKSLKAYAYRDGISPTVLRQWAWEVTYTTPQDPQQERKAIGYPIGNFEGWGLIGNGAWSRTHSGVTLIDRGEAVLNIFDNWQNFLALESADFADYKRGDVLVLNDTQDVPTLQKVGAELSYIYKYVYMWNNRTAEVLRRHLVYKQGVNGYWYDPSCTLCSFYDWRDLWHYMIDSGHQRPQWVSCLRCREYTSCMPLRGNLDDVCDEYAPIIEAGKVRHKATSTPQK